MDDAGRSVTWKATLIGAAMTLATSTAGYISSHFGGVTSEQLKETEARIGTKIDNVDHKVAKSGDDLKTYVDEKFAAYEARTAVPSKKRKARASEP